MAKETEKKGVKPDDQELINLVDERYEEGKNWSYERQCYINLAYYAGHQWIAWDENRKTLYVPPMQDADEERLTFNHIEPIIRIELAKIIKNKPMMDVMPQSNDDGDVDAAKAADKLLDHLWDKLKMSKKVRELVTWFLVCGTSYLKIYWNAEEGKHLGTQDDKDLYLGEVGTDVVNPLEITRDPSAETWAEVRWVIQEKTRDVGYIKDVYGIEVKPEENISVQHILDAKIQNITGLFPNKANNMARVREYYEMPTKKHPKGRRITTANGKLLFHKDELPYGKLPFEPFIHIPIPGRVEGDSVIKNLIPVQREYNQLRSQNIMYRKRMLNGVWLVPRGSVDDEGDITNEQGAIIEYDDINGQRPFRDTPPAMPNLNNEINLTLQDFEDISGQHEVSQGSSSGAKSGVALSFLKEQDDTKISTTIQSFEDGIEAWGNCALEIVRQNYIETRYIPVIGKNKEIELIEFMGSDIKEGTSVKVQAGSALPQSLAAKQELIISLWTQGILQDPMKAMQMLELGQVEDMFEDINIDINQAKEENKLFEQGQISPVRDFYNHAIHIEEHNKFRKSKEYMYAPPELQQAIDQHVMQHEQFIANQMIMQQQQMVQPQ